MTRFTKFAVGIAGALVLVGAAAGAAFLILTLTAGRGTLLDRMVPSDAAGYASANLDPPADQKLDLLELSRKFPDLGSQANLEKSLDQSLQRLGLTYTGDIKPWLGAQVVVVAAGSKPDGALLLDSRDDSKAQAALAKLRTGPEGQKASWHTAQHGGVTLEVGALSGSTAVLAYFDHTALLASSQSLAGEIIDTDQGKHARLDGTAEYRAITRRLPPSRLLTVYGSGDGLRAIAGGRSLGGLATTVPAPSLAGYSGFGAAVSARPDGLTGDFEVDVDVSRMPPSQQAIFKRGGRANLALTWMPGTSTAVFATTKLDAIAQAIEGALPNSAPVGSAQLDTLTGDAAVEVEGTPSGSQLAVGAVIGTTDPRAFTPLINTLGGQAGTGGIASAVQGQYLVLGSSPEEMARLQSAHAGGPALAGSAAFKAAQDYAVADPDTLVFVDVQSAFRLAGRLGLGSNATFQAQASRWSALRSLLVTSSTTSTRVRLMVS